MREDVTGEASTLDALILSQYNDIDATRRDDCRCAAASGRRLVNNNFKHASTAISHLPSH